MSINPPQNVFCSYMAPTQDPLSLHHHISLLFSVPNQLAVQGFSNFLCTVYSCSCDALGLIKIHSTNAEMKSTLQSLQGGPHTCMIYSVEHKHLPSLWGVRGGRFYALASEWVLQPQDCWVWNVDKQWQVGRDTDETVKMWTQGVLQSECNTGMAHANLKRSFSLWTPSIKLILWMKMRSCS